MDRSKVYMFGAYVAGMLDGAASRKELTSGAIDTMVRGLIDMHRTETAPYATPYDVPATEGATLPVDFSDPTLITQITDELQRRQAAMSPAKEG